MSEQMKPSEPVEVELPTELKDQYAAARKMIADLCKPRNQPGHRDWIMSIPADLENDPDIVISQALRELRKALLLCLAALASEKQAHQETRREIERMKGL